MRKGKVPVGTMGKGGPGVPGGKARDGGTGIPDGCAGCWAKDEVIWANELQRKKEIVTLEKNFKKKLLLLNTITFLPIYW